MRGPRYNMCLLVIDPGLRLELLLLLVAVSAYIRFIFILVCAQTRRTSASRSLIKS